MPRYEFTMGRARWFWDVNLEERSFTIEYGKVGTIVRPTRNSYASSTEAKKQYDRLIATLHEKGLTPLEGDERSKAIARHAKGAAKQAEAVAKVKHPLAKNLVSIREAADRLKASGLSKRDLELATHPFRFELRPDSQREPQDKAVWIDEPWTKLGLEAVPAKRGVKRKAAKHGDLGVGLVVFTKPVVTKYALSMRYEDLLGYRNDRDEKAVVFLGPVHARDVNLVPGVIAVFAGGLTVDRIAVFDGADSHARICHHLHAPLVISGVSEGGAQLAKDCNVRIGAYAGHIGGMPKGYAVRSTPSVAKLLPFSTEIDFDREMIDEDADAWELYETVFKDREFPSDFKLPRPAKTGAAKPAAAE